MEAPGFRGVLIDEEVAEKVESVVPGGLELVLLVGAAEWGW